MTNRIKIGVMLIIISVILVVMLGIIKTDVSGETSWPIDSAIFIAVLLLGIGAYMLFSKEKRMQAKALSEDGPKLDKDERRIYDVLKQNKGSVSQGKIPKEAGFSKEKTKKILDKMVKKKIIGRKRKGRTKLIVLK